MQRSSSNKKSSAERTVIIFGTVLIIAFIVLGVIIYINAGYKTLRGSFGYTLRFNTRKYSSKAVSKSLDMFEIKDMSKADTDCYVYVGTYDPEQNLQETLDIINSETGTDYVFMTCTVGAEDYPAIFVDYRNEKGGNYYIYYIDYEGHNFVIQTLADDKHQDEIDRMVDTFTITDK